MGLLASIADFLSLSTIDPPPQARVTDGTIEAFYTRLTASRTSPWRLPTIVEALGVPAIQRAVTLISTSAGSLTVQGFRYGALMDEPPRLVARPDPYETPRDFYRDWAYLLATRGEAVHWIASRDNDGIATALVAVPPAEVTVEENPRNRLFPVYKWGTTKGTRYSAANPTGEFVHTTYLKEPGALRGVGPLQLNGAASSVSVEAQEWAANFYAGGASSSVLIKHAGELSPTDDADGLNEAERLKAQWMDSDNNTPRVVDQNIESVDYLQPNPQGAQMLAAREYNNGDAARMFGIPGALLEYNAPGSSLTYQNIAEVWHQFVKGCLAPQYLEPMEQALSDLLPRSQTVEFRVERLLRADIKTRYEVYGIGIDKGIHDPEYAQRMEGIIPGSPEVAPVPFAPASAVPTSLPEVRTAGPVRCDGMHVKRISGVPQLRPCNRLLAEQGPFVGSCPRCKKTYAPPAPVPISDAIAAGFAAVKAAMPEAPVVHHHVRAAESSTPAEPDPAPEPPRERATEVHIHMPEGMVRIDAPVTVHPPDIHVDAPVIPQAPATTIALTMPDTDREVANVRDEMAGVAQSIDRLVALNESSQAALAGLTTSNQEVAARIAESTKPRRITAIRDPDTGQISGMTSEVA